MDLRDWLGVDKLATNEAVYRDFAAVDTADRAYALKSQKDRAISKVTRQGPVNQGELPLTPRV